MPFLPCLLCGRKLEKRTSKKNGKPYFVCDSCGIQLFIRKKQGIELLEETFRNLEKAQIPFRIHARNLYEIQAQIKEIDGTKAEIEKLGIPTFLTTRNCAFVTH
jgi:DNA-directed RNA polymerase subunit RPC12/RpoP